MASTERVVYVAWDDTRNAVTDAKTQDVYFARVRVDGEAILVGSAGGEGRTSGVVWLCSSA